MISARTILALSSTGMLCIAAVPHLAGSDKKPTPKRTPTYAKDIAPILYSKCASCHHAGEVAPFNLTSYEDARDKAPTIVAAVKGKLMPPWQALSHGQFKDERTLTKEQVEMLQSWSDAGSPAGNLKEAPKAPTYTPGWSIGTPDFVGQPTQAFNIASEGADVYRCFVIPTNFPEGRFVQSVECRPGNRSVVHHIIAYLDGSGVAKKKVSKDGQPGYESFGGPGFQPIGSLGGWAPGLQPEVAPHGEGMWLPKGADIVLQVHYHKNGKQETDLSKIGIKFASGPVDKRVRWESVDNEFINIPAGEKNYEVKADLTLAAPVTLLDVIPHMHLLGHDMKVDATLPDGSKKELINVAPYDFNWQTRYTYKEPVHLPKGTKLSLVAHYDNSKENPHNPNNPPKKVTFGEQTTNEMCFAFFSYTIDSEHLLKGQKASDSESLSSSHKGLTIESLFEHFDANHDGKLDPAELAEAIEFFDAIEPQGNAQKVAPKTAAAYLIAMYGKKEKGSLTKDEFGKFLMQYSNK